MREVEKLYQSEKFGRDKFYEKRESKQNLKRTGGVKPQSPIWDEDDK